MCVCVCVTWLAEEVGFEDVDLTFQRMSNVMCLVPLCSPSSSQVAILGRRSVALSAPLARKNALARCRLCHIAFHGRAVNVTY